MNVCKKSSPGPPESRVEFVPLVDDLVVPRAAGDEHGEALMQSHGVGAIPAEDPLHVVGDESFSPDSPSFARPSPTDTVTGFVRDE